MGLNRGKRMVLNARYIFILIAIVAFVIGILVFVVGHKSVLVEFQITLSLIFVCLFLFISICLYVGIKLPRESKRKIQKDVGTKVANLETPDIVDVGNIVPDISLDIDFGDDPISAIFAIVVWIVISLGILIFLANIFTWIWGGIISLIVLVYWVFYKALRRAFSKSRLCMGNIKKSILYSLYYTALYTGWIYLIVFASRFFGNAR